jgi:trigger factor
VNVTVEDLGPCKKLLRIEVPQEKVEETFLEMSGNFQREAKLPGFRPGKAPKDLVAKRFEKEIRDEVKSKLINEGFRKALKDNNYTYVGRPDVEEVQFGRGQAMQFTVTTEIAPQFEVPEYKGLKALRDNSRVTEEDIQRALKLLADQRTEYKTVDRELKSNDIAVINYSGTTDGKPLTDIAPTARGLTKKENFWVNVDATSFIPGFGDQLAGMKAGDKRTVNVDFPGDFVVPQLAGKKGSYEVDLVEAKEKVAPPIDDAFARNFGAENLDKLREGVRGDLQNELNTKQSRAIRNQVAQSLLDKIQIDLPESLVEHETRDIVYNIVHENTQRGTPKEVIDSQTEQIYATAKTAAQQRVKATLLFQRIAEKEGVRVEQADLLRRLQDMAAQLKTTADKLYKDLQKSGRIDEIVQQILNEKVVDLLVQFAHVEDAPAAPKM